MTIVFMILLAIFVIVFFVFIWKSADTWRWYHLLSASLVMLLALIFLFPLAGVFKSRMEWNKRQMELEDQLARVRAENELLLEGDVSDPNVGEGLLDLQHQLQKLGSEAGRVWRGLQRQGTQGQAITLATVQAQDDGIVPDAGGADEDGAQAGEPVSLAGLDEGMIVYGFGETLSQDQEMPLPTVYLGEFRVTASEGNEVTIEPTGQLSPPQQNAIGSNRARRWSLYEMLPLDGHEPFVAEGSVPTEDALFGRMDEELIDRLLGGAPVRPETREAYKRDGSRANANDPPETRWVKIEFTKPYELDVDSTDQRGALDGGFFDSVGRAVDSRLQGEPIRNAEGTITGFKPVAFKPGVQLELKEEAAQSLLAEDVAKLVDTYFVRPLNDYRFVLRRLQGRIAEMDHRRDDLEYQIQVINEAVQYTEAMLVENQKDKLKLEKDAAQVATERKAVEAYRQKLADDLAETRRQLIAVYRSNLDLTEQLAKVHQELETEINERTEAASR